MTDETFQPTPKDEIPRPEQASPARIKYRDWLTETLDSEFGPDGEPHLSLEYEGKYAHYEKNDFGGIEHLIGYVYNKFIPDEEKPQFRQAVVDIFEQKTMEADPDLDEIRSLLFSADDLRATEAVGPIVTAVLNNKKISDDEETSNSFYGVVAFLTGQQFNLEHREETSNALQRLMDDPSFKEEWLCAFVESLLYNNPNSAEEILKKYEDKLKKALVNEADAEFLRIKFESWVNFFDEEGIRLSPEQLAIIQI